LVLGLLTASVATGQLVFLPLSATIASQFGWIPVVLMVGTVAAVMIPIVYFLLPEQPKDVGLTAYGATPADVPVIHATGNPISVAFAALGRGARHKDFWLLAGGFFVCGLSTNGLIGAHLIAACFDQGIPEVRAASLVAMMGLFNLAGTTLSGWLSDRWDNRWLLFWYYALRGVSLLFLPYSGFSFYGLSLFAVFYGLDWLATVPPTVRLTQDRFGKQDAPILFGWIFCAHQIGSAFAAFGAGFLRTALDRYLEAFLIAGFACAAAAIMSLMVGRARGERLRPAMAAG
jgi:predicted MFS family arabinose efflux permease